MSKVDYFRTHTLQDAAHDVDGGIVSVKQTRSGNKPHFLRGLVIGEGLEFSGQVGHTGLREASQVSCLNPCIRSQPLVFL